MSLRLTREQRRRLFDGDPPRISGTGKSPVKAGDVVSLSSRLSLRVLKVNPRRGGGWSLHYELHDRRDPVLILKRTPGAQDFEAMRRDRDEYGYPGAPTPDAISEAALESAYTSSPTSLSDAGEAVHPRAVDEVNKRRREHRAFWEREKQQLVASLKRLSADPETRLAAHREIRALQRQIDALDRRLRSAA